MIESLLSRPSQSHESEHGERKGWLELKSEMEVTGMPLRGTEPMPDFPIQI